MELKARKVVFVILFISTHFALKGAAIKCYKCGSVNSLDECHGRIKKFTCPNGFDRCLKANWTAALFGDISEGFLLGCARPTMCKWQNYSYCMQTSGQVSCSINCCASHFCNAGSVTDPVPVLVIIISIILLNYYF